MDSYFVHRTRAIEGKDGNPLNEVRMLSTSSLRNKAELMADKAIEYKVGPQSSALARTNRRLLLVRSPLHVMIA